MDYPYSSFGYTGTYLPYSSDSTKQVPKKGFSTMKCEAGKCGNM